MEEEDDDRLSNLPEALIHHIFSFLQISDVVKMSSVSTQWRYFWRSFPYLICINDKLDPQRDYKIVETIISRDKSSNVQRCTLLHLDLKDPPTFYRLMDVIAGMGLQQLDLHIKVDEYPLPQCILDCESLVSLSLDSYRDFLLNQHHVFGGFKILKSLKLRDFKFADPGLIGIMISSCPVLETLIIACADIPQSDVVDITAPNLKRLKLDFGCSYSEYQLLLKIACPKLQSMFLIKITPINILLEDMPSLENVHLDGYLFEPPTHREGCYELVYNFNKIRSVKVLEMRREFVLCLNRLTHFIPPPLNHLKSLTLVWDNYATKLVISFLHSSPNLESLRCWVRSWEPDPFLRNSITIEDISCLNNSLKTLQLVGFGSPDIDLMRFFLKEGHCLECVKITWNDFVSEDEQSQIISVLKKLPTSSANVKFKFRDWPPWGTAWDDWDYDGIDSTEWQTAWEDWK